MVQSWLKKKGFSVYNFKTQDKEEICPHALKLKINLLQHFNQLVFIRHSIVNHKGS